MNKEIILYTSKNGDVIVTPLLHSDTFWLSQEDIATLFGKWRSTITEHLWNIFKEEELNKQDVILKVGNSDNSLGKGKSLYNLDAIIAVGYRVNSKEATGFRIWATNILREHITQGFTVNKSRIQENYEVFLQAVEEVQKLLPGSSSEQLKTEDILELIKSFANTWLSLDSYDKDILPTQGFTKTNLKFQASELYQDVASFKNELISSGQATEIFAQEKNNKSLEGIFWNIFQSFDNRDLYPSIEEKAAHFLYFIVKNHPFTDGNKRTGAFSFLWFLSKVGFRFQNIITPETLTAITLLVAESNPKDKERIVGLIILLLKK
jgi:prophage maintenance system killer protein